MSLIYEYALKYIEKGIKFYPVKKFEKFPAKINGKTIEWKEELKLHQRLPTESECNLWFNVYDSDIAIITGKENNLVVIDCDDDLSIKTWEKICNDYYGKEYLNTIIVKSRKGLHYYYEYPKDLLGLKKIITKARIYHPYIGIDLKGDGGCVKAPPSRYSDYSDIYKFLGEEKLKEFPIGFLNDLLEQQKREQRSRFSSKNQENFYKEKTQEDIDNIIKYYTNLKGGRNERCFKLSCKLKDLGFSIDESQKYIEKFTLSVSGDHAFTLDEAWNCLKSAYKR